LNEIDGAWEVPSTRRFAFEMREPMTRILPTCDHELAFHAAGYRMVAGIDEVGRGALAGPVVAGCVVVEPAALEALGQVVRDSKTMSPRQRERAYLTIFELAACVSIGMMHAHEIDQIGIGPANRMALEQAVHELDQSPDLLICDAFVIEHPAPQFALIDGDALSVSVAAASIVAKVTRDRMMTDMHQHWAEYGFDRHVGYGTKQHLAAIQALGPCPEHRRSFSPVRGMIEAGWSL
jgi:ribonuclease HII